MARLNVTCLNCGQTHSYPKSDGIKRKFCSQKCQHEYKSKKKSNCEDCGVEITIVNAYNRSRNEEHIWLDNLCKSCRIKRNRKTYINWRARQGDHIKHRPEKKRTEKICGYDGYERGQQRAWEQRMICNKHIFEDVFSKPATLENIQKAAVQIGV